MDLGLWRFVVIQRLGEVGSGVGSAGRGGERFRSTDATGSALAPPLSRGGGPRQFAGGHPRGAPDDQNSGTLTIPRWC